MLPSNYSLLPIPLYRLLSERLSFRELFNGVKFYDIMLKSLVTVVQVGKSYKVSELTQNDQLNSNVYQRFSNISHHQTKLGCSCKMCCCEMCKDMFKNKVSAGRICIQHKDFIDCIIRNLVI